MGDCKEDANHWMDYEYQTNYQKVREFRQHFPSKIDNIEDQFDLIVEEYIELHDELFDGAGWKDIDKQKAAKELSDLLYVCYDLAIYLGIDIDRVFDEVHKSNMSKLGEDGKPVYREDGKVLKGPNYQPPKLDWITK
jgi:predicted HAD superfamily Cof-like phosphohydrolase